MTANTAYVLRYALAPGAGNFSDKVVDFAAGEAQLFSPVDGDLVIVFSAGDGLNTSSVMKEIPFLRPFVYTAAGPASLVDAYSQLLSVKGAASGDGPLADVSSLCLDCWIAALYHPCSQPVLQPACSGSTCKRLAC
jgi:hypothetical protein